MISQQLDLNFNTSFHFTVHSHGWFQLAPWQWEDKDNSLSRTERFKNGKQYLIKVYQNEARKLNVETNADTLDQMEQQHILNTVTRWFSLDWNPLEAIQKANSLDSRIASFIEAGGGRFLRSSTFYEDFVKTICTINTNWQSTLRMSSALVDQIGKGTFPTPREVIMIGRNLLSSQLKLGFRSRVLIEATNHLLTNGIINENGQLTNRDLTFEDLLQIRGIGPYSASHIMMLCHDYSRIPIDSTVVGYCKDRYNIAPNDIQDI